MQLRLKLLTIFFIIGFTALIARLFFWQIYKGKELSASARVQYRVSSKILAPRGEILSSDDSWLASSGESWLVYAQLPDVKLSPKRIAEKLAPLFVGDEKPRQEVLSEIDRLTTLLSKKDVVWVPLKQRLTPEVKKRIETLDIEGIGFEAEEVRVYPEASSAAHLLGFVGKDDQGDNVGYFGLEGYYDFVLSGKPGFLSREKDALGVPIPLEAGRLVAAIEGVDLITHIEKGVQLALEKRLLEGVSKYGASGGVAIVLEPKTGAVLGMSSYPSYDPATYWQFGDAFFLNPAISSSFEPGSVFKVLVMAAALDAGVVTSNTKCDNCSGPVVIDKYIIETWNQVYNPDSSMVDVIVNSDNVGMVFVSRKLGKELLYKYLQAFGIGEPTGIDLQGEASPRLREEKSWGVIDLATAGFGQGVAVTPIQMITAISAVANDGVLVKPQVVDKISGEGWEEDIKPVKIRKVISKKTASKITGMMVEAAMKGEAKWTHMRGFKVAGKTGTAQIPIEGHYEAEKTIASFVGFAPYDKPKFVMLVTLQGPTSSPWASETAAPLWYSIARDLFVYFGIQPEN